jgi:hypothetical protein
MAAAAKITMKLISVVVGIPVGIATKKAVERTWLALRPEDPPRKPSEPDVHWADAIGWGALSAAGIVAAELLTRRSSEAAYKALTGSTPPPPKQGKDKDKKKAPAAAKAAAAAP